MYNRRSVGKAKKSLAILLTYQYNIKCWSLTAMKRKVADTPGRFATAVCRKFPWRSLFSK
ncbi:hypothetical protein FP515_00665 [Geobacillus thermoleovorans]|uniref:Uncharacterized protein n=3 Tax=Geobacillus thermoleovorans group TaxID=1505648 RepID=A0AA91QM16_9BACL|nr:hypothetical protein CWI35_09870 [[Bacillus] caldolyticus]AWO74282.1 hypothetical protein C1N76_06910 [Geobacillus thermoleovorans]OQP16709.1 hypothetical protein B1693_07075 [Geobacillus zalihae]OXB87256.1 hypothetical protein B9L19_17860 [Geobacillus thermocatenulatus]QCK81515.1 hypothetical protein E5Z46_03635 [Geobacillus kaustophilus NBRC 102445]RXS90653.1 hypothetical protein ETR37_04145 [Geobacillus sp. PK12]